MARLRGLAAMIVLLAIFDAPLPAAAADDRKLHSFDAKGVKIHFLVEGKGEPVVLIHGLHSSARN